MLLSSLIFSASVAIASPLGERSLLAGIIPGQKKLTFNKNGLFKVWSASCAFVDEVPIILLGRQLLGHALWRTMG
jgi:hypothetical protein